MAKANTTKQAKKNNDADSQAKGKSAAEIGSQLVHSPFAFMKRFGEEMERLFEDFDFGRGWLAPGGLGNFTWAPQIEMFERDGNLIVRADLPGLTKDDVNVELNDGGITIEGERHGEKAEKGEGFYRSERSYGKFYRRLPLPEGVNVANANASFNNGVLEITMAAPKRVESKRRRLEIRDESQPKAKSKAA